MNAQEIIQFIHDAEKKTPVKVYVKASAPVAFSNCKVFGEKDCVVFGEWADIEPALKANADRIVDCVVESDRRNSAVPLLDVKPVNARIEPGAIIRDRVEIGDRAVIMMGAVINIGAVVGADTMIDMRSASTPCGAAPWPGSTACSSSARTNRSSSSTPPPAAASSRRGPSAPRGTCWGRGRDCTTWTTRSTAEEVRR